jgi:DNA (cytosine-5)-methyltransferase 1
MLLVTPHSEHDLKALSLFSGVGGFDLGFHAAGHRTTFMCEWDKHATAILNRHFPNVPKWGDITTLTGAHILSVSEPPDVVIWGSPCQDLSAAGKRAGIDGPQSGMFYEGIRIIRELREATNGRYPRISVWENVYGALNSNRGADFGVILDEMAAAGALVIEWRVLDAQYFGVPQRRRRVFVVAVFDPATAERCPDPLLPVGESVRRDIAAGDEAGQGTADQTSVGVGSAGVVGALAARDYKGVGNQYVQEGKVIVQPMVAIGIQGTMIGRQDHNGPGGTGVTPDDGPMFTLTSTDVHAVMEPTLTVRRLTPLECERLMGWPDNWTAGQADSHRYKQCGNGVASPVAEWIGRCLADVLRG